MTATLGQTIRATRMGYHALDGVGFVKIHSNGPPWIIQGMPFSPISNRIVHGDPFLIWWDNEFFDEFLRKIFPNPLEGLVIVELDDDGSILNISQQETT
jgi:hypothetical protein